MSAVYVQSVRKTLTNVSGEELLHAACAMLNNDVRGGSRTCCGKFSFDKVCPHNV